MTALSRLRQFDFSPLDYITDKESVVERACQFLKCRSKKGRTMIGSYIEGAFRSKKDLSVVWEPTFVPEGGQCRLTGNCGGIVISGMVSAEPKSIRVLMDLPCIGGTAEKHLDRDTPVSFADRTDDDVSINDYGIESAKSILTDLLYAHLAQKH